MASFNKVIIVGYLGRDPEIRYTADGTPVCSFSVATTERKKDKSGEFQDVTTWFRVSVWRRQAELANQYLSKGKQVYIEGRLSANEYQDRDGNTRTSLDVQASDIQFLSSRSEGESVQKEEPSPRVSSSETSNATNNISDDDIPF